MIPLRDNIPSRTVPFVNYLLILVTSLVFVVQLLAGPEGGADLVEQYGMIPARVSDPGEPVTMRRVAIVQNRLVEQSHVAAESPLPAWLTLFSCIFLHGGWMHFLGNMWFLHIFGDNVEDRLGHGVFLLFYVGCGVAASAAHLLAASDSPIPTIGASGAIAGVMGAYFLLYPHAKVLALVPIIIIFQIIVLPAPFFLGVWFLLQFLQGSMSVTSAPTGGVAWWAHIGGFAVGAGFAGVLKIVHATRPPVTEVRPNTEHVQMYRYRR